MSLSKCAILIPLSNLSPGNNQSAELYSSLQEKYIIKFMRLHCVKRNHVSYPSGNITKEGRAIVAYDRERTDAKEILIASFTEEDIKNGVLSKGSYLKKIVSIGGKKGYI